MALPSPLLYLDFETYYSTEYSLSRMTTIEYIRHPEFKVHGMSVAVGDGDIAWLHEAETAAFFQSVDLSKWFVVGHNLPFDGAIITQRYGKYPKGWVDTLGMARAVIGTRLKSLGLDSVGKALGLGGKLDDGRALQSVKGVRDLTPEQLALLGHYARDDVRITRGIAKMLATLFPEGEYPILDWTVRMAVLPRIVIDQTPLVKLEAEEAAEEAALLAQAGVPKTTLSSNPKFADLLRSLGVEPPKKKSKTTGKETYAFAKSDEEFLDLLDHPDDKVHDVVAARLSVKSTIKESRARKLRAIGNTGLFPVELKYSGAMQTHRLSGGGGNNVQNFTRGSLLRQSLKAPPGFKFVVADLSQIELRGNCLASGQLDILDDLRHGRDVYLNFAKEIYGNTTLDKHNNPQERTVGKIAELSLGYYSGAATYKAMLRAMAKIRLDFAEAQRIVRLYRRTHPMIAAAWKTYGRWLQIMLEGSAPYMDHPINLPIELKPYGFVLPSGLEVTYPGLTRYSFSEQKPVPLDYAPSYGEQVGLAYVNAQRGGYAKVHSGVFNNNVIQSVCRDVNFHATKTILSGIKDFDPYADVVMSVHDETVSLVREEHAEAVLDFKLSVMKTPPPFWPDLPVDAEGAIGDTYGDAK